MSRGDGNCRGRGSCSARGCVTAGQPTLEVEVRGHRSRIVGQTAEFVAVVRNVADVAATNIEIVARCDEPLEPSRAEPGHQRLPDGGLVMRIEKMEAKEQRTFRMEALCSHAGPQRLQPNFRDGRRRNQRSR